VVSKVEARVLRKGDETPLVAQRTLHRTHRSVRPLRPASLRRSGVAADAGASEQRTRPLRPSTSSWFEPWLSEWQRTLSCVRCPSSGRVRCKIRGSGPSLDGHRTHVFIASLVTSCVRSSRPEVSLLTVGAADAGRGASAACVRCNITSRVNVPTVVDQRPCFNWVTRGGHRGSGRCQAVRPLRPTGASAAHAGSVFQRGNGSLRVVSLFKRGGWLWL
jgi:hypothetical protein